MGQRASRHEDGANSVKTGLALSVSGAREVSMLRYSHPAPLRVRSSVHEYPAQFLEAPQHDNPHTLSDPPTEIHKAIKEVPVEIFLKIGEYLSPASVRSLSYTCHSLSRMLGASAAGLMGKPPEFPRLKLQWGGKEAQKPRSSTELNKWLELVIMLHRDNMWPGKAFCNDCIGVHDKPAFSESSLHSPPRMSKCLGVTGWVKICPHTQFNFWSLMKTCNSPEAYKRLLREEHARIREKSMEEEEDIVPRAGEARLDPEQMKEAEAKKAQRKEARKLACANMAAEQERVWTTERVSTCDQCIIPVKTTSWGCSRVCFPLAVIRHGDYRYIHTPSATDLTNHTKSLEAAVCPHLKINSSEVMKAYCNNRKRFGGRGCSCPACSVPYRECEMCHAKFWFDIGDFEDLQHVIQLIVRRSFDPSVVGVANPTWINQLIPETAISSGHGSWWFDRMDDNSIKDGKKRSGIFYASLECYSQVSRLQHYGMQHYGMQHYGMQHYGMQHYGMQLDRMQPVYKPAMM